MNRRRRTVVVLALAALAAAIATPATLAGVHNGATLLALFVLAAAAFLHFTPTRDEVHHADR